MQISVLGIGTELTSGQILNRNGPWISEKMRALGVATSCHLVVPDEKHQMLEALRFCAEHSDVVFVTGGLGPTSDDFTRDIVAQWCGQKLVWNQASWEHISERLSSRGIAVKEIQKQQCFYPENSEVLMNRLGTANAFFLTHQGKDVFVLPGPPKEIEAVWGDFIQARMQRKTQGLDLLVTKSWDTIGLGESDMADLAEKALQGCPFEKAYRVHLPYVEFKLTFRKSQATEATHWLHALEEAIGPITALRNGEDAASKLATALRQHQKVLICDELPGSFLINRLFPFCKPLLWEKKLDFITEPKTISEKTLPPRTLFLHLWEDAPGSARVEMNLLGQKKGDSLVSPYKALLMKERESQYYSEMALLFWLRNLC